MKIPPSLRWKPTNRTLGEGGQGQVLEVTDGPDGTVKYALKGLARGKPQAAYQRFEKEIRAIQGVQHPGIISIVDHSIDEAFSYYVMEYPEGAVTLRKLIRSGLNRFRGDAEKSLRLFIAIVEALSACEEKGIVYRDLSPANVLILPDDSIRLIDFGLCQMEGTDAVTLVDEGVGTPCYMAPECESGSSQAADTRSDLYAAGKILWAAVSGQEAFSREAPAFTTKSMPTLFPISPATWHLHHVFERTIRGDRNNRWSRCSDAIEGARHLLYLILNGYPALKLIAQMCPICGFGKLTRFAESWQVFRNGMHGDFEGLECDHCHICVPRNVKKVGEEHRRRANLQ